MRYVGIERELGGGGALMVATSLYLSTLRVNSAHHLTGTGGEVEKAALLVHVSNEMVLMSRLCEARQLNHGLGGGPNDSEHYLVL